MQRAAQRKAHRSIRGLLAEGRADNIKAIERVRDDVEVVASVRLQAAQILLAVDKELSANELDRDDAETVDADKGEADPLALPEDTGAQTVQPPAVAVEVRK